MLNHFDLKKFAHCCPDSAQPSFLPGLRNSLPGLFKDSMSADGLTLPLIDLSRYINPRFLEDKERVIAEVRDAGAQCGFFQIKGHGIPLSVERGLLQSIDTFLQLRKNEKRNFSFLKNVCR